MGAQASTVLPIQCAPTTALIGGKIEMAPNEYISRIYMPFFGAPVGFRGRPIALCAAKSPLGGFEQYIGSLTGRSEYIYSPNGFRGFRCFKDGDGIVQKIELFENGAPGTPDSQLNTWTISTAIGQTLKSWTTERIEKNGMVANAYSFEISGPGAENGFGSEVYLRDFNMDFAFLSPPPTRNAKELQAQVRKRASPMFKPNATMSAAQKKQAEECAARMVAEKKRESRVNVFRYRIVPALVLTAIVAPLLFG